MKTNITPLDAGIRSGLGLLLLSSPLLGFHTYPYNLFGAVLIATGLASFCPIYAAIRGLFAPQARRTVRSHG